MSLSSGNDTFQLFVRRFSVSSVESGNVDGNVHGNGGKCAPRLWPYLSLANLVNAVNERLYFLCFILRAENIFYERGVRLLCGFLLRNVCMFF